MKDKDGKIVSGDHPPGISPATIESTTTSATTSSATTAEAATTTESVTTIEAATTIEAVTTTAPSNKTSVDALKPIERLVQRGSLNYFKALQDIPIPFLISLDLTCL